MISLAFLLSGASGLIFQLVWFHRSGLVFGNSIWAVSIVLSSFMGGLALGSALVIRYAPRLRRLLLLYAVLELVVAAAGVALTVALPELPRILTPITRPFLGITWLVNLVRLAEAFALLVLPATAMGATLPVLTGALGGLGTGFGRVLGRLYGWNTLGAVAGVLAAETLLIPALGVFGSALTAGALNLAAAGLAFVISRGAGTTTRDAQTARTPRGTRFQIPWRTLTCAFLAGGGLMALEVVWFRMLSMLVVNTTLAVSLMLAVVLTAIGLGGLAASAWMNRRADADTYLPAVAFAAACVLVASYQTFHFVTGETRPWEWHRVLWFALWLTSATSLLSGIMFTLLGQALRFDIPNDAQAAGWLVLANTTGAMAGPLVAAFVLLPVFGMERSLFGQATLYCVIGLLTLRIAGGGRRKVGVRTAWAAGLTAVLMLALFPFGLMSGTYFAQAARPHVRDGSEIIATREGTAETIFLTRQAWRGDPIYYRLVTNGFSMTATALPGKRYMRQFVYWPMLLREAPLRRVLVICYGVGVTAAAATDVATVESIDVVEISPDIVGMSDLIYAPGERPLSDPRVRLHLEDGRYFLQTTAERFDLITGEPPPPLTPGTVNIYTREYFQLIHDRLTDGGITTYWLPVARQENVDHAAIVRAFCDVFETCSLWNGTPTDLMLMGTRGAIGPIPASRLSAAWNDRRLGPRLREAGFEQPEQVGATFLGDAAYLTDLTGGSAALVDNYPRRVWLSSRAAASREPKYLFDRGGADYLNEILSPARARQAFQSSAFIKQLWPDALAGQALPFFEVQRIINRVLSEGANVLGQIEDVHLLLTQTSLQTLPFWLVGLGNHPILQRVDTMPNDGTGQVEYVRGLRALVARDFAGAALELAQADKRGLRGTRPLLVYALCLAGELEAARQVAQGAELVNAEQRHFWAWIRATFGVGP